MSARVVAHRPLGHAQSPPPLRRRARLETGNHRLLRRRPTPRETERALPALRWPRSPSNRRDSNREEGACLSALLGIQASEAPHRRSDAAFPRSPGSARAPVTYDSTFPCRKPYPERAVLSLARPAEQTLHPLGAAALALLPQLDHSPCDRLTRPHPTASHLGHRIRPPDAGGPMATVIHHDWAPA